MNSKTVLWVYIVLLMVGGLIGFFKGKSTISLVASGISAALLVVTTTRLFDPTFARGMANVVMAALLVLFTIRLAKTKKFMPSGLMLVITLLALFLRNV